MRGGVSKKREAAFIEHVPSSPNTPERQKTKRDKGTRAKEQRWLVQSVSSTHFSLKCILGG